MIINELVYKISKETNTSLSSIARLINESPQNFNNKLKRGTLSLTEFEQITKALNIDINITLTLKDNRILTNNNEAIINEDVLEFCIFCIEKLKDELNVTGKEVYLLLSEKTHLLYSYITKNYDVLHTQDEKYIVNDLKEILLERKTI